MKIVSFDPDGVRRLVEHAQSAPVHAQTYGQKLSGFKPGPGLWLVGSDGLYLISNGIPRLNVGGREDQMCKVFARGFSPDDVDWYDRKVAVYGPDDSADHLDAQAVLAALDHLGPDKVFRLGLTPRLITILG